MLKKFFEGICMVESAKKLRVGVIAVATIIASTILAFALINPIFSEAASTASVTDFAVPSGSDPWGTAFDSRGQVWVALPGCDPTPQCPAGAAPGKIGVFDPATR